MWYNAIMDKRDMIFQTDGAPRAALRKAGMEADA